MLESGFAMQSSSSWPTSEPLAVVKLKPRKALPFYGRHPWVLATAVDRVQPRSIAAEHMLADGSIVDLVNEKGKFIARGFYNGQSRIRVRLFSWREEEKLDAAFFERRLAAAIQARVQMGLEPAAGSAERSSSAARLVFSEADGISGLVIDRYGDYLVVQATSAGMQQRIHGVAEILERLLAPKGMVLRGDNSSAKLEGIEPLAPTRVGEWTDAPIRIVEHGISYEVDLTDSQKTGFYLDQRDNRLAVAKYFGGRKVLDMFCYTGGFAMNASRHGNAAEVLGVDTSKRAVAQAEQNAQINGLTNLTFESGDGFQTLERFHTEGRKFDAIVLDPPKFARSRSQVDQAIQAYHRLNRAAIGLLPPGGILVTHSCSGSVSREDFLHMLSGVSQKTGRDLQILEQRGAAADHPVSATCLETEYLKCVVCRVGDVAREKIPMGE